MDEERRRKYFILQNKMINIKEKTNQVIDNYEDLIIELKNSLLINDKIIYHEELESNLSQIKNIKVDENKIIISINNKI